MKKILVLLLDRSLSGLQSLGSELGKRHKMLFLLKSVLRPHLVLSGAAACECSFSSGAWPRLPRAVGGRVRGCHFWGLAGRPAGRPDAGRATLGVSLCGGQHPDINRARSTSRRRAKPGARRKAAGEMGETTSGILFGILGHINSHLPAPPNLSRDIFRVVLVYLSSLFIRSCERVAHEPRNSGKRNHLSLPQICECQTLRLEPVTVTNFQTNSCRF